MNKIIIIAGGGHAKVLASVLKKLGNYDILGYIDEKDNGPLLGIKRLGDDSASGKLIKKYPRCSAALGIGSVGVNPARKRVFDKMRELGFRFPAIVSPSALINEGVTLGEGTVVFDGAIVNSGSVLGECVIVNTNASIDHDCRIGGFTHVAPGAALSGGITIGDNCLIGTGASVIQGIKIGSKCLIGAGSAVVRDCLAPGTYAGVPAKKLR